MEKLTNISSVRSLLMYMHAWVLVMFRVFFWKRWKGERRNR